MRVSMTHTTHRSGIQPAFASSSRACNFRLLTRVATENAGTTVVNAKDLCKNVEPGDIDRRGLLALTASSIAFIFRDLSLADAATAAAGNGSVVFVAGSTGQTGRRTVQELRARGFKVKAGVRDLKKAQGMGLGMDSGVELVKADVLKPEQLAAALVGVSGVVCATGYSGFNPAGFGNVDETGTKNLIDAAKKAGVSHFVLLSSLLTNALEMGQSNNPNYKFLNLFGGVLDHKLAAEKYLKASGMTWTVVRPGGLSSDPPAKVGNLVVGKEDTLFGLEGDAGREISRDTVAQVLAAALQQGGAENKVFEIVASKKVPSLPEAQWFA